MNDKTRDLQRALTHMESARALLGVHGVFPSSLDFAMTIVEKNIEDALDEPPHTPTAQTMRLPTVPPSK